VSVLNNNSIFI